MDYVTNVILCVKYGKVGRKKNTDAHVSLVGMKIESWKGAFLRELEMWIGVNHVS